MFSFTKMASFPIPHSTEHTNGIIGCCPAVQTVPLVYFRSCDLGERWHIVHTRTHLCSNSKSKLLPPPPLLVMRYNLQMKAFNAPKSRSNSMPRLIKNAFQMNKSTLIYVLFDLIFQLWGRRNGHQKNKSSKVKKCNVAAFVLEYFS